MRKTLMTRLIESFNGVVTAMMWHYITGDMAMSKRCGAWFRGRGHGFNAAGMLSRPRGMLSRWWASFRGCGQAFEPPGHAFEAPGHAFQTVGMTDGSRQRNEQVGEYRGRKTPSVLVTQHSL